MKYILVLFMIPFYGQVIHHQMLSSQGISTKLPDGIVVRQTIGQQSQTGTASNKNVIMQGFQHNFWGKYIASNPLESIKTITFPNPFVETINFEFSKIITEEIIITVFDIDGRLVFEQNKKPDRTTLTILLPFLPASIYLVRLSGSNFSYFTKIMKL